MFASALPVAIYYAVIFSMIPTTPTRDDSCPALCTIVAYTIARQEFSPKKRLNNNRAACNNPQHRYLTSLFVWTIFLFLNQTNLLHKSFAQSMLNLMNRQACATTTSEHVPEDLVACRRPTRAAPRVLPAGLSPRRTTAVSDHRCMSSCRLSHETMNQAAASPNQGSLRMCLEIDIYCFSVDNGQLSRQNRLITRTRALREEVDRSEEFAGTKVYGP